MPLAAFKGCYMIETITLPEALTAIGDYAFQNCTSLNSISGEVGGECTIPRGVKTISQYTFQNCSSFTKLNLSAATVIENYPFNGCSNVADVGAYVIYSRNHENDSKPPEEQKTLQP